MPLNLRDSTLGSARYLHSVTAKTGLNARRGPSTSYAVTRTWPAGATLRVVCQAKGQRIDGTRVWNRLAGGGYVTDAYVDTGRAGDFSRRITRCKYPYQVTADVLRTRRGPGTGHRTIGSIPRGGLAWVVCQARGTKVGKSSVWNKLHNGVWIADWYTTSPGRPGWTWVVPRCP